MIWLCGCPACNGEGPPPDDARCLLDQIIDSCATPVCEPMVPYYHRPDTLDVSDEVARSVRFVAAPPEDAAYDW